MQYHRVPLPNCTAVTNSNLWLRPSVRDYYAKRLRKVQLCLSPLWLSWLIRTARPTQAHYCALHLSLPQVPFQYPLLRLFGHILALRKLGLIPLIPLFQPILFICFASPLISLFNSQNECIQLYSSVPAASPGPGRRQWYALDDFHGCQSNWLNCRRR